MILFYLEITFDASFGPLQTFPKGSFKKCEKCLEPSIGVPQR